MIIAIREDRPDFFFIGDVDTDKAEKLGIGMLDEEQMTGMREAFSTTDVEMDSLFKRWETLLGAVNTPYTTGISVDTERTERFTKETERAKQFPGTRWKMALTYMYTMPGIPVVTYGSEIALNGGEKPDNHRMMNFRTDEELIDYMKQLSALRKKYPALRTGDLELLQSEDGMVVFKRETEEQTMIAAINNSSKTKTIQLDSAFIQDNQELRGKLNTDLVREQNGTFSITLEREMAEVYLVEKESGINYGFLAVLILVPIAFILFLILARKRGRQTN